MINIVMQTTKQHLKQSQMNYWYHLKHSMANGFRLQWLAISSFVHAIFPMIGPQHAARGVIKIYNNMRRYRHLRELQQQLKDS